MRDPVFVLTPGHTGSSAFMDILQKLGCFLGQCFESGGKSFNENRRLLLMNQMVLGADTVTYTASGSAFLDPWLSEQASKNICYEMIDSILFDGYELGPWALKDPRLCLTFDVWDKAFPKAQWIVLDREPEAILKGMDGGWMPNRLMAFSNLIHKLRSRANGKMFYVGYEELGTQFTRTVGELSFFLGIDSSPATLKEAKKLWQPK